MGARFLSHVLRVNRILTTIKLQNNCIRYHGAYDIAMALRANRTLTSLDLQGNDFQYKGLHCITEALRYNRSLVSISLTGITPIQYSIKVLRDVLQHNFSLCYAFGVNLDEKNAGYLIRNIDQHNRVRRSVITLIALRQFCTRKTDWFFFVPLDVVKRIAEYLWSTRLDHEVWGKK